MSEKVTISGVELTLSEPADVDMNNWVGNQDLINELKAAWLVVDDEDLPLNPALENTKNIFCHKLFERAQ